MHERREKRKRASIDGALYYYAFTILAIMPQKSSFNEFWLLLPFQDTTINSFGRYNLGLRCYTRLSFIHGQGLLFEHDGSRQHCRHQVLGQA